MGKYIKTFDTHDEYESYITGSNKILPNVSYCKNINDVHYNPETRVIAKFNVTSTSSATTLTANTSSFSEMEIDGVVQSNVVTSYTFDSIDEHTVKYTLSDPTSIGSDAFHGCIGLTTITTPNSVTSIGSNAFNGCSGLTSINIPSGVTSIGSNAFNGCSGLTSINIPSSVTSIGNNAFNGCSGLRSIRVESGNTVYDSRNNCNAIIETATNTLLYGCQNTIIPSDVTSIGRSAFSGCSSLTSITIPNSVTSISANSFQGCSNLTSITIPSGVTDIGAWAFFGCSSLTSITIPNSVTSISNNTFYACSSLTSITIPSGVTSIGISAFRSCSSLNSITSLATTAPTIQSDTFRGVKTGGTLHVPTGSSEYDAWMGTGNYYLGQYNWTKVEQ